MRLRLLMPVYEASKRHDRFLAVLAGIAGLATWADLFVRVIGPGLASGRFPTSTYWVAPQLVLDGRGQVLFDPVAFAEAAVAMGAASDLGFVPNAPAGVLPLLPLGLLDEATAYPIWTVLSVCALVAAVAWLLRTLRWRGSLGLLVLAALPLFHPLRSNIAVGQAYAFVLLAVVVAGVLFIRVRPGVAAGLSLAAIGVLKLYYGLALIVPAVIARSWTMLAAWAAALAAAVVVSAAFVGVEGWLVWLQTALSWRTRPETSVTAYQTLNSLFGHLMRFDTTWNPGPVADLPLLAELSWFGAAAVMGGVSAWILARVVRGSDPRHGRLVALALLVPVALVLSPIAEDYHYVLALFPLFVAAAALVRDERIGWGSLVAYGIAVGLLAPAWPFNQPIVEGWAAVVFYPRVYGAILLWGLLAFLAVRHVPASAR